MLYTLKLEDIENVLDILEAEVDRKKPTVVYPVAYLDKAKSYELDDLQIYSADRIGKLYDQGRIGENVKVSDIEAQIGVFNTVTGEMYFVVDRDDDFLEKTPDDFYFVGIYRIVR